MNYNKKGLGQINQPRTNDSKDFPFERQTSSKSRLTVMSEILKA